eukprot:CAMPEP_0178909162 /NCGR_PEP_ID=MMETSP0786-20121207/8340_1 /TAXON_ID=186022 /ORGANISM="Thalassionema frauenfeldii, Strain CCMP 1798" /LENGTH=177 /DNA_ID=CAMNT_0020581175 /DNA_START=23 /DNA_END=556 /DNA_ORIENTATION=+
MSSSFGSPPIVILAAKRGDTQTVRRLLDDSSLLVDATNTSYLDRTCLHYATEAGNIELATLLVEKYGASVDVADRMGDTPLHLAIQRRRYDTVVWLVDTCHANVQQPGKGGNSALHYASQAGEVDTIEFLMQRGASVEQVNDKGCLPKDLAFRRKGMMELTNRIQDILKLQGQSKPT